MAIIREYDHKGVHVIVRDDYCAGISAEEKAARKAAFYKAVADIILKREANHGTK